MPRLPAPVALFAALDPSPQHRLGRGLVPVINGTAQGPANNLGAKSDMNVAPNYASVPSSSRTYLS